MRKLLWFTLGFGAACALGTYFAPGIWLLLIIIFGLLTYGGFSLVRHRRLSFAAAALAALGLAVGCFWYYIYDGIYLQPARMADGMLQSVFLEVTDYPEVTDYGVQVDGLVRLENRSYGCRLYLNDPEKLPQPGDCVAVQAKLRLTTDGGTHEPTWHRTGGIFLLAYAADAAEISPGKDSLLTYSARLRRAVSLLLQELYGEDTQGFARALLLGDQAALTYTQRNQLAISGICHVVAVSGMHLSIAYGMVQFLIARRRVLSALVGLPVIWIFAAVAGFTPSVVRSAVMLSLSILAQLVNREYDGPTALAVGALVLLVANPLVMASVGFQLSVGAVAGIQCFAEPSSAWLHGKFSLTGVSGKLIKSMLNSLAISCSAGVFTVPIVAANFGMVSLLAPLSNILLLWVVSWIFYGTVGACILGALWLPAGRLLAWLAGWLIRFVLWGCGILGDFPWAAAYTDHNPYLVAVLICAGILLCLFILCKYPGKRVLALGLSFVLLLSVLFPVLESQLEDYRVTVLDVGQGQCVILQSDGRTFVVDCGGSEKEAAGETAARYLLTQGICRIDGLVITHYDDDHVSGVPHLLSRIDADALYLPLVKDEPACRVLGELGERVFYVTEDISLVFENAIMRIFAPVLEGKSNESGLSVLFTVGKYDTLITGDLSIAGEWQLLKRCELPKTELLIAGHHGSKNSTGDTLLDAVKPEGVAISAGEDNVYNHPAMEMLLRAASHGCKIYRTDQSGTLIFRG